MIFIYTSEKHFDAIHNGIDGWSNLPMWVAKLCSFLLYFALFLSLIVQDPISTPVSLSYVNYQPGRLKAIICAKYLQ